MTVAADHPDSRGVFIPRWMFRAVGQHVAAAPVLAQVLWWYQPDKRGKDKSPVVYRGGERWLAVSDEQLAEDTGLTVNQVAHARRKLVALDLLVVGRWHLKGVPRIHYGLGPALVEEEPPIRDVSRMEPGYVPNATGTYPESSSLVVRDVELLDVKQTLADRLASFDAFWAAYPNHRGGKAPAVKAFEKAARKVPAEAIVEAARRLASDPNLPDEQFIPYPATWLNREQWTDPPCPPRVDGTVTDRNRRRISAAVTNPPPRSFAQAVLAAEGIAQIGDGS